MRFLRLFIAYCALSLLMVLPHLILAWPRFPQSALGWLVFALLPVPLAVAGEWLLAYRQLRLLRLLDVFGDYVHRSNYGLPIVTAILVLVFVLVCAAVFYIDVLLR